MAAAGHHHAVMSRAFVKEIDDAPAEPVPERAVSPHENVVTPRGARLIRAALAAAAAAVAGAMRDEERGLAARDLRYWQARAATLRVVPPDPAPAAIGFGVRARVRRAGRIQELQIVGEDEADPARGLIAWTSPLAEALDGAEIGDIVEFEAGGRVQEIEVLSLS